MIKFRKEMNREQRRKVRMNLQLFAEGGDGSGAAGGSGDSSGSDEGGSGEASSGDSKDREKGAKGSKGTGSGDKKYSDADVDAILDKKFAEWSKKQAKAVEEADKLARMNEKEKAEYERDQMKKELEEYKRKDSLAEMTKTARRILSESNINISDELLSIMVTTDAEETKKAIDGFSKAFNAAVEDAVKARLKGEPPKKGSGGQAGITKESIMAIKDPMERQKMIAEHKDLFGYK